MIFNFFGKSPQKKYINLKTLKVDIHSHLLPGIDDGAENIPHSIELTSGLKHLGFSKLITTPHIRSDMFKNTADIIRFQLDRVQEELKIKNIDISLQAAAEYYLDDYVLELLKKKEPLLTVKDNMVLVEFSILHQALNMRELIFELQMAGYKPIIAHPERYIYLHRKYDLLHEFKENGCLFQLNLLSASLSRGKILTEMVNYFIDHDFYDFAGTDAHHLGHLRRLQNMKVSNKVSDLLTGDRLRNYTMV